MSMTTEVRIDKDAFHIGPQIIHDIMQSGQICQKMFAYKVKQYSRDMFKSCYSQRSSILTWWIKNYIHMYLFHDFIIMQWTSLSHVCTYFGICLNVNCNNMRRCTFLRQNGRMSIALLKFVIRFNEMILYQPQNYTGKKFVPICSTVCFCQLFKC